jgi:hypothetical protein
MKFLKHQAAHLRKGPINNTIFSPSQTGETVPLSERKGSHSCLCPWLECYLLIVYEVNGAIKQKNREIQQLWRIYVNLSPCFPTACIKRFVPHVGGFPNRQYENILGVPGAGNPSLKISEKVARRRVTRMHCQQVGCPRNSIDW